MKVYLAGKISKNCWRHDIVSGFRGSLGGHGWEDGCNGDWPIMPKAIRGSWDFVGPHFANCDHGCYHNPTGHGVLGNEAGLTTCESCFNDKNTRRVVWERCLDALQIADVVFAWLDSLDCFGTLVEIGHAKAAGKIIALAGPYADHSELWFVRQCADWVGDSPNAREAFDTFFDLTNAIKFPRRNANALAATEG